MTDCVCVCVCVYMFVIFTLLSGYALHMYCNARVPLRVCALL